MSIPYRNDVEALRERKSTLEGELAKLREQTTRLGDLKAKEVELATELARVEGRLSGGETRRALPLLDQVRVASPCSADWNAMVGDDHVRFCSGCEKNVFNLSTLSRDAAETLLRDRLGTDLCIRFYQRTDGTILSQDCPTGVKKKRRKKLAFAVAGAGALAAAATMFTKSTCSHGGAFGTTVTQGAMGPVAPIVESTPSEEPEPANEPKTVDDAKEAEPPPPPPPHVMGKMMQGGIGPRPDPKKPTPRAPTMGTVGVPTR